MTFRIKEARKLAGLSQSELAVQIGVAQNTLSGYEKGVHDPKSDILMMIARVCGVTVDFLLGREEEQKEKPSAENSEELLDLEIIERLTSLTPEELARVDAFVQGLLASR